MRYELRDESHRRAGLLLVPLLAGSAVAVALGVHGRVHKLLGLRRPGLPGWVLPVLGGLVFTLLVGLWWTSALWFFGTSGVRF